MPRRAFSIFLILAVLAIVAVSAAILCGSSGCFAAVAQVDIVWQLRFPRALAAFSVGALLAIAGALMQVLLRNPLADPYVLGVSGGAATGAMITMLLAASLEIQWGIHAGALVGALCATGLLFGLTHKSLLQLNPVSSSAPAGIRLILTGVMIASGFSALMMLMLSVASDARLRGMVFWLMGDLADDAWYGWPWAALMVVLLWSHLNAARLNVLTHGDITAQLLGVRVARLRSMTLCMASLATAAAVAVAGTVGFVGLVVPHALRLVIGNDQRILLPASVLLGGAALTLADLLARSIVAPVQLPVGVVTALIGVPMFLILLAKGSR